MGIRLYNKMTTRIKQLDSFRDFKRKLKLFLLDHPFYVLNEFFIFEEVREPVSNNTCKTRCKQDFMYCESCYYEIRLVYWIINHTCVVD